MVTLPEPFDARTVPPRVPTDDTLLVLKAIHPWQAKRTKRLARAPLGGWYVAGNREFASHFRAYEVPCSDIYDLYDWLKAAAESPECAVIRGAVRPGRERAFETGVLRRL